MIMPLPCYAPLSRTAARRLLGCSRTISRRHLSSDINTELISDQLRNGSCILPTRRLIEIRGPQASQFLQGLTTANIPPTITEAHAGRAIYSAFLNAQGRLQQDVFLYPVTPGNTLLLPPAEKWTEEPEQHFLVEVDSTQVETLTKWLKKYRLRAKVAIREVPRDQIEVGVIWHEDPARLDEGLKHVDVQAYTDARAPAFGSRFLMPGGAQNARLAQIQGIADNTGPKEDSSSEQQVAYQIRRYLHGVAEGQTELVHGSALVHDSNIDLMGGVDFRKGCYVGQELVIRTQHTGVVRKRIMPCVIYDASNPAPDHLAFNSTISVYAPPNGADIKAISDSGSKARSKGKWIAGVGNIGLAMCRLEDMVGIGPAGDAIEGYEEKEWGLEWEGQSEQDKNLRVKAFVPDWWRDRIRKTKISEHGVAT